MSDPDQKLADLLRRGPAAPTALDEARREALRREAKQAWFQARSARRGWTWALAAAAGLAAVLTGWALVATAGTPAQAAPAVAAAPKPAPAATPMQLREERTAPTAAPASMPVVVPAPVPPAALGDAARPAENQAAAPMAGAAAPTAVDVVATPQADTVVAARESVRPDRRAKAASADAEASPFVGAVASEAKSRAIPPAAPPSAPAPMLKAAPAASAPAAPAADVPETALIPPDAPERGKLLAAAAIVHAARTHVLAPQDRNQALQAAIDLIARIQHPVADDLRRRIAIELRKR